MKRIGIVNNERVLSLCVLTYRESSSDPGVDRRVWLDIASLISMPEKGAMSDLVLTRERSISVGVPADYEGHAIT